MKKNPGLKLKPCPFCGESDAVVETKDHGAWGKSARVVCMICGASAPGLGEITPGRPATKMFLETSAITAWNTRKKDSK